MGSSDIERTLPPPLRERPDGYGVIAADVLASARLRFNEDMYLGIEAGTSGEQRIGNFTVATRISHLGSFWLRIR